MASGDRGSQSLGSHRSREMNSGNQLTFYYTFRLAPQTGMAGLSIPRVGLLYNSLRDSLRGLTPKVTLNPVKVTMGINLRKE